MQKAVGKRTLALIGALVLILAACTPIREKHGFAPSPDELDAIVVGVDNRDTVEQSIGAPTTAGMMQDDAWYYVESNTATRAFLAPKVTSRKIVAISFDKAGTVRNLEEFGLADGRVVTLNRRVSNDNIKGVSFLRQLLGNIGNFTAGQILGQNQPQ